MSKKTLLLQAREAIEREDVICFDICANCGQIFGNVKHMRWFVRAVADELGGSQLSVRRCELCEGWTPLSATDTGWCHKKGENRRYFQTCIDWKPEEENA